MTNFVEDVGGIYKAFIHQAEVIRMLDHAVERVETTNLCENQDNSIHVCVTNYIKKILLETRNISTRENLRSNLEIEEIKKLLIYVVTAVALYMVKT